jgi:hypothetical protein
MVLLPKPIEFFELRQAGKFGHAIEKHFSDQVIQFMLNTDAK